MPGSASALMGTGIRFIRKTRGKAMVTALEETPTYSTSIHAIAGPSARQTVLLLSMRTRPAMYGKNSSPEKISVRVAFHRLSLSSRRPFVRPLRWQPVQSASAGLSFSAATASPLHMKSILILAQVQEVISNSSVRSRPRQKPDSA